MGALSPVHLILILLIALLVIGPGKLPETGAALGHAIRDFRQAMDGTREAASPPTTDLTPPAAVQAAPTPHSEAPSNSGSSGLT